MTFVEACGWLALAMNLIGNWALAMKRTVGWPIRLACNVAFFVYSWSAHAWPLLANHGLFAIVNCYGWHRWSRAQRMEAAKVIRLRVVPRDVA